MAASQVQRMAVFLAGYLFDIRYLRGQDNGPADALSRVINHTRVERVMNEKEDYSYLKFINNEIHSLNQNVIREETEKDPELIKIREHLMSGWPEKISPKLKSFKTRESEFTLEDGCIL